MMKITWKSHGNFEARFFLGELRGFRIFEDEDLVTILKERWV